MSRIALLDGPLVGSVAHSESLCVSVQLTLHLRDAPSRTARIVQPSLTCGDLLEVLGPDGDSEFLEVATEDGRQRWVHGQYVVAGSNDCVERQP